jgi:hypothetical protein
MREVGRGEIAFAPLAEILRAARFTGWVCTDLDYLTDMDADTAARVSMENLEALFRSFS